MRNCQIVSHYMMELELEFVVLHLLSSCFIFSVCGVWRFWVRAIMETLNGFNMSLRNDETKSKSFIRKMFSSKERNRTRGIKNSPAEAESVSNLDTETPMVQNIKTLRVFMATWNVGGKCPPSNLTLDDFLQVHESSDIYVLGFQEIVPLNAGNVLVEDNEPSAKWLALVNRSLNGSYNIQPLQKTTSLDSNHVPTKGCKLTTTSSGSLFFQKYSLKAVSKQFRTESKKKLKSCNCISELERKYSRDSCFRCQPGNVSEDDMSSEEEDGLDVTDSTGSSQLKYGLIVCKQMVGIFLTIWVKKELVPYVSHLRSCHITRGIMGCLGNKGCISVSMSLYQTSFCFICSHLASGEKEGDELRRNLDVIEILKNTQFPKRCRIPNTRIPDRILEHDRIIWLGDLNYRIALSHGETIKLVQKNEWDILLSKDQLKIEREAGRVFKGWKEGRIYFAPTYKYSYNSNTYIGEINNSPNKRRTPAWCDRILWHGNGIRQLSYVRKDSKKYQFSDHRPVCATFLVDVPVTEAGSRKGIPSSNMKVEIEELLPASSMW